MASKAAEQDPEVQDGQKTRKKKAPPLSHEEFLQKSYVAEQEWHHFAHYYAVYNSKGVRTDPASPNKNEMAAVTKIFPRLNRLHAALCKITKRQQPTGEGERKGFNMPRLVRKEAVTFFNTHCKLPEGLKVEQLYQAGGDGIMPRSEGIQLVTGYIEMNNLKKDPTKKSEITMDKIMTDLFRPHLGKLERSKWVEKDGCVVTSQPQIQKLIPLLFDAQVAVPPAWLTEAVMKKIDERSKFLTERTETEKAGRVKAAKEAKEAKAEADKKAKEAKEAEKKTKEAQKK